MMFADCYRQQTAGADLYWFGQYSTLKAEGLCYREVGLLHNGKANMGMLDGHVTSMSFGEIKYNYEAPREKYLVKPGRKD